MSSDRTIVTRSHTPRVQHIVGACQRANQSSHCGPLVPAELRLGSLCSVTINDYFLSFCFTPAGSLWFLFFSSFLVSWYNFSSTNKNSINQNLRMNYPHVCSVKFTGSIVSAVFEIKLLYLQDAHAHVSQCWRWNKYGQRGSKQFLSNTKPLNMDALRLPAEHRCTEGVRTFLSTRLLTYWCHLSNINASQWSNRDAELEKRYF